MFKFLHASDLHLDSPLIGLEKYEGAPVDQIRGATREALQNLVSLAITEKVNFVILAGDLYDGDWKDYSTALFFNSQMSKLHAENIPAYLIAGNHDAASQITRFLKSPDNLKVFSTDKPESVFLEHIKVAIHGQGFHTQAVTADLSQAYPVAIKNYFNIGILHTSLDGREGHARYAPCAVNGLKAKSFDYWALGHVHKREVVSENPWIVFPGNTQGRNMRETGPKGCTLVEVENSKVKSLEHRDLDVLRWFACEIDLTENENLTDGIEKLKNIIADELAVAAGRLLATRITIRGSAALHSTFLSDPTYWKSEIRAGITDASQGSVWIEQVIFKQRAKSDPKRSPKEYGSQEIFLSAAADIFKDGRLIGEVNKEFDELNKKLPADFRENSNLKLEVTEDVFEEAKQLLVSKLFPGAEP